MPSISQSCSYGSANRFATFYFSRPIHPFIGEIITSLGDKGIIKPTSAKYLSGFLAKKSSQRTDYDPKLVNCSIFRHHPSQLYDEVLCIEKNSINLYFELIPTWISESYLEVCMDIALITRDITNPNPKDAGLFNFYKLIINESLVQMSVNQAILMGGCAMNSKANKIVVEPKFKFIWSLPNPGDPSSSVGAVLYHTKQREWEYDFGVVKHIAISV